MYRESERRNQSIIHIPEFHKSFIPSQEDSVWGGEYKPVREKKEKSNLGIDRYFEDNSVWGG